MGIAEKIQEIEAEMARTQKNKATGEPTTHSHAYTRAGQLMRRYHVLQHRVPYRSAPRKTGKAAHAASRAGIKVVQAGRGFRCDEER